MNEINVIWVVLKINALWLYPLRALYSMDDNLPDHIVTGMQRVWTLEQEVQELEVHHIVTRVVELHQCHR